MTKLNSFVLGIGMVLLMAGAIPTMAQQPGDVYMWEFNEGGGETVTDNSGQYAARFGVYNLLPSSEADSPSGATNDRSVNPNGGFRVDDSDSPVLADLQNGPVTVECWVKPTTLIGWTDLTRIGNSIKAGFSNVSPVFTFLGIVDIIPPTLTVPVDGDWHHVAYVWEPGVGVTFYLDGDTSEFVEETGVPRDYQNSLMSIGSDHAGTSIFNGLMDRLRIHQAVVAQADLDVNAANPTAIGENVVVAYNFDEETHPYQNSTSVARPAISMGQELYDNSKPQFSPDSPTGEADDYSLSFDGNDRVIYDDNQNRFFDFINEPATFEVWMKFVASAQVATRPIFFAYGQGGAGGYSFSIRPARPALAAEGVSGQPNDFAIIPQGGLTIDDTENPVLAVLRDSPVTVEAWVKPSNLTGFQDVFRIGNSLKAGFADPNGTRLVFTLLGIVDIYATLTIPNDDAWHHVAYQWEPGVGVTFYVDGASEFVANTNAAGRDYQNAFMSIGASHASTSPLQGSIDRLRVHNALLTEDELDSDPANPKAPLASTVVAYNFDEGAVPYQSSTNVDRPATNQLPDNFLTATTYGILDAHSNARVPNDGQWHHVAAVIDWDGLQLLFYVDGELADSIFYDQELLPAPDNEAFLYMGSERGGGNPYVGLLDRIKVTRGALTPDELDYFEPVSVDQWSLY